MQLSRTIIALAASAALSSSAVAQTAPAAEPPLLVAEDVRGIRQALDRLVVLLEGTEKRQQIELLLKRIELMERRLDPLERRLRSAQSEVEGLEGEQKHIDVMREQAEQQIDDEILEGTDRTASEARQMLQGLARTVAPLNARLDEARLRVRRAEDELADGRDEIAILDEKLLELLDPPRRGP